MLWDDLIEEVAWGRQLRMYRLLVCNMLPKAELQWDTWKLNNKAESRVTLTLYSESEDLKKWGIDEWLLNVV